MSIDVEFLPTATIEAAAEQLLAQYAREHGPLSEPPIPIEEILECHLGLSLGLGNLSELLGLKDVIGALWVERREVIIEQSLDPSDRPPLLGRYRFTVGHEAAHWVLHRPYLDRSSYGDTLFDVDRGPPSVVCRTGQAKERIEWQADRLSAAALMPRRMILEHWRRQYDGGAPITLEDLRRREYEILQDRLLGRAGVGLDREARDKALFRWVARPLAEDFEVSPKAMCIRLKQLGLLVRKQPADLFSGVMGCR